MCRGFKSLLRYQAKALINQAFVTLPVGRKPSILCRVLSRIFVNVFNVCLMLGFSGRDKGVTKDACEAGLLASVELEVWASLLLSTVQERTADNAVAPLART